MDLARVSFVNIDLPDGMVVVVDAGSGNFDDWARSGLKRKRWSDGLDLVRDLLTERTLARVEEPQHPATAPPAFERAEVEALPDETLQAFSATLLTAARGFITPKLERDRRKRIVRRDPAAAAALFEPADCETPAERLLRILMLQADDRNLGVERGQDKIRRMVDPLGSQSPALKAIREVTETRRLLGLQAEGLSAARDLQNQVAGLRAQSDALRAASLGLTAFSGSSVLSDLSSVMARRSEILSLAQPSWRLEGFSTGLEVARIAIQQQTWAADIDRMLGLGLPATTLASLAALDMAGVHAAGLPASVAALLRPGWRLTSEVLLAGLAAPSAGAAVLGNYDADLPHHALLGRALEDVHVLDGEPLSLEEYRDRLAETVESGLADWGKLDNPRRNLVLALLTLLVAIYAAAVGTVQMLDQLDDSDERRAESASAETNAHLARLNQLTAETLEAARASKSERCVSRKTLLRVEPAREAAAMQTVFPDQLITVVDSNGEWVKVEVADYDGHGVVVGWLPRSRVMFPG